LELLPQSKRCTFRFAHNHASAISGGGATIGRRICSVSDPRIQRSSCASNLCGQARLGAQTSANAFLNELALPYANNSKLKMVHITSCNERHQDSEIEPSIVTGPTTADTSPTGAQCTQGLVYQGLGPRIWTSCGARLQPLNPIDRASRRIMGQAWNSGYSTIPDA
jgi:hypothetical protein